MISKDSFKNGVAPAMKMKMACLTLKQVRLSDLTEEVVFKNNCCLTLCESKLLLSCNLSVALSTF